MKTGRITFGPASRQSELAKAIDTIRNPGGGMTLVSHGFTSQAKATSSPDDTTHRANEYGRLANGCCAAEGVELPLSVCMKLVRLFQHALESGQPADAVDPSAADTGKPTTRA